MTTSTNARERFSKGLIAAAAAGVLAAGSLPGASFAQSLDDVEDNATDRSARDALLAERNRQDQFQFALRELSSLVQDALRLGDPLNQYQEVRWSEVHDAASRIELIAKNMPEQYENQAQVDKDLPSGMTFGSEDWVRYAVSSQVLDELDANDSRKLAELRESCENTSVFRGKYDDAQDIVDLGNEESCSLITNVKDEADREKLKEIGNEVYASWRADQRADALTGTLASAFGVEDQDVIKSTFEQTVSQLTRTEARTRNLAEAESRSEMKRLDVERTVRRNYTRNMAGKVYCTREEGHFEGHYFYFPPQGHDGGSTNAPSGSCGTASDRFMAGRDRGAPRMCHINGRVKDAVRAAVRSKYGYLHHLQNIRLTGIRYTGRSRGTQGHWRLKYGFDGGPTWDYPGPHYNAGTAGYCQYRVSFTTIQNDVQM